MTASPLPEYEMPPVAEVAFGVTFAPPAGLTVAHFGKFWSELPPNFRNRCQEAPPLDVIVEVVDGKQTTVAGTAALPAPRLWFVSDDDTQLIQLQRNRLLCNWRKTVKKPDYPRYANVGSEFWERYGQFVKFVEGATGEPPKPFQYELVYVNHIPAGELWQTPETLGNVLPGLAVQSPSRFLPEPESVDVAVSYGLAEGMGRLHARARIGHERESDNLVLILELTARGFDEDMLAWFTLAHEWIVRGFEDITSEDAQVRYWGKAQ